MVPTGYHEVFSCFRVTTLDEPFSLAQYRCYASSEQQTGTNTLSTEADTRNKSSLEASLFLEQQHAVPPSEVILKKLKRASWEKMERDTIDKKQTRFLAIFFVVVLVPGTTVGNPMTGLNETLGRVYRQLRSLRKMACRFALISLPGGIIELVSLQFSFTARFFLSLILDNFRR